MDRFEQFKAAVMSLHDLDSYFQDDYVRILSAVFPEYANYRVLSCWNCREVRLTDSDGKFCSEGCATAYENRPRTGGINLETAYKTMKPILDEALSKAFSQETAVFKSFK